MTSENERPEVRLIPADKILADACRESYEQMLVEKADLDAFAVPYKGGMLYFQLKCIGVRPAYTLDEDTLPEEGDRWFGQRAT